MKFLVTGGAGFIGSHVSHALLRGGHQVVVLDDFSTGRPSFVPPGAELVEATLLDTSGIEKAFRSGPLDAVIHVAGYKFAGESVQLPLHTYQQNVVGMMNLLQSMGEHECFRIIFSSSAAVYGEVETEVIPEGHPTNPANPYGESKLIGEWLLRDAGIAYGLRHSSLRYFNVVGSSEPGVYDTSPHSLFSLVFRALLEGRTPKIFGDDYSTVDGTCVRDYIPVGALAVAHVVAAERLVSGATLEPAYNLGTGTGHSVASVMAMMAEVTGHAFEPDVVARRPGDPATVVASGALASRDLEWNPETSLRDMVTSAWEAFRDHHSD